MNITHNIILVPTLLASLLAFAASSNTQEKTTAKARKASRKAVPISESPKKGGFTDIENLPATGGPKVEKKFEPVEETKPAPVVVNTKTAPSKTANLKDNSIPHLEIEQFRFQHHKKEGFERLVLQFRTKKPGAKTPVVKTTASSSSRQNLVQVQNVELVGAIPESAINSFYAGKSHYFGPIAIDSASSNSVSIHAESKDKAVSLDAFWLENPSRLVLDMFGTNSERASGAALSEKKLAPVAKKNIVKAMPSNAYICFPYTAQVPGVLTSENAAIKNQFHILMEGADAPYTETKPSDAVFCYPKASQIAAKVEIKETPATVETPPSLAMPALPPTPAPKSNELPKETPSATAAPAAPPLLVEPTNNNVEKANEKAGTPGDEAAAANAARDVANQPAPEKTLEEERRNE